MYSIIDPSIHSLIQSSIHSSIRSLINPFVHSFIHSFHLSIHSFLHWFFCSFLPSFTYLLIHPSILSLIHLSFSDWQHVVLCRRCSRVSNASRGADLRIEELKQQNKQLLEELFSLKRTMETKDEELDNTRKTVRLSSSLLLFLNHHHIYFFIIIIIEIIIINIIMKIIIIIVVIIFL